MTSRLCFLVQTAELRAKVNAEDEAEDRLHLPTIFSSASKSMEIYFALNLFIRTFCINYKMKVN